MVDLVIGGPISRREWILPVWYHHVQVAAERAGVTHKYLHVGSPSTDPETWAIIADAPAEVIAVHVLEPERSDRRHWIESRYRHMTDLRNLGLAAVRTEAPAYFLSLDSDILLHPDQIVSLLDAAQDERWAAVGGKCYMTTSAEYPSYGTLARSGGIVRPHVHTGLFKIDVIMGIKLMKPAAYGVDYDFYLHGEDTGWAKACHAQGLVFAADCRVASKHCHDRAQLGQFDPRIGW